MVSSQRDHIQPEHPLVERVFGRPPQEPAELSTALEAIDRNFVYRPIRGRAGFDRLVEALDETQDHRPPINCFDYSCLLVSHLRAAGWNDERVFVAPCDIKTPGGTTVDFFHCGVVIRHGWNLLFIDPAHPDTTPVNLPELLLLHRFHLLFNDRFLHVSQDDKTRALRGPAAKSGWRLYLYGQENEAISELLGNKSFRALLKRVSGAEPDTEPQGDDDILERATGIGLLEERDGRLQTGAKLTCLTSDQESDFHAEAIPLIDLYEGIAQETVPALRACYETCTASQRFPWTDVEHTVVAGLFLDLAIGRQMQLEEKAHQEVGETMVWAFESITASNSFGVQWAATDQRCGLGQLWHSRVKRARLQIAPALVEPLARFALGDIEAIDKPRWQFLRYLKMVSGPRDQGELRLPHFLPAEVTALRNVLDPAAREVAHKIAEPACDLLDTHLTRRRGSQDAGSFNRFAALRLLLDYATDRLIQTGLLHPFPVGEPTAAWGRWLWIPDLEAPGTVQQGAATGEHTSG